MELVNTERNFAPRVRKLALRDDASSLSLSRSTGPKDFQEALRRPPCFLGSYFTKVVVSRLHTVDRSLYLPSLPFTVLAFHFICIASADTSLLFCDYAAFS
jgi:hypothetical protein